MFSLPGLIGHFSLPPLFHHILQSPKSSQATCWTHSRMWISVLYWRDQYWMLQRGLASAKQREWSFLSTGDHKNIAQAKASWAPVIQGHAADWCELVHLDFQFFSAEQLPRDLAPACLGCEGSFHPRCRNLYLLSLFKSPGSCQPISPGCSGPSDELPCHAALLTASPSAVLSAKLARAQSHHPNH